MKTSAQAQVAPGPAAPIVPVEGLAPVTASGITNKTNVATDAHVEAYAHQIRIGKPTGKIFPNKLSEMQFSDGQREVIRLARKTHKENCIAGKKELIKKIQAKDVRTVADRSNREGTRGRVGWVKDSAFHGKDGKFSQGLFDKFVAGPAIKPAKA
jgi:hypothetical protein